jgi:hypothetical protein
MVHVNVWPSPVGGGMGRQLMCTSYGTSAAMEGVQFIIAQARHIEATQRAASRWR